MRVKTLLTAVAVALAVLAVPQAAHAGAGKPAFTSYVTVANVAVPATGGGGGGSGCGDVCYYNDANFAGSHQAIVGIVRGTCYNVGSTYAGHISSEIINVAGVDEYQGTNCSVLNRGAFTTSLLVWPWNDAIHSYGIPN